MPKIPLAQLSQPIQTGDRTIRTPQLQAATNDGLAKGLSDVAKTGERIVEMARDANDVTNLTDASISMQRAQVDFAKWQQENPNEQEWLPKWESMTTDIQGKIGEMKLTPRARAEMTERFSTWSSRGTVNVQSEAFRQAGRNAIQATENAIAIGEQSRDFSAARQSVGDLERKGVVGKESADALRIQIDGKERNLAAEDFQSEIRVARKNMDGLGIQAATDKARAKGVLSDTEYSEYLDEALNTEALATFDAVQKADPVIALNKLKVGEFPELKPSQRDQAKQLAEATLRDYQAKERSDFADLAVSGAELDNYKFKWIHNSAEQKEMHRQMARTITPDQAAVVRLDLEPRISKYDRDADPDRREMMAISAELHAAQKAAPYAFSDLTETWSRRKGGEKPSLVDLDIADNDGYLKLLYAPKFEALMTKDGKSIKPGKEAEYRKVQSELTDLKKQFRDRIGKDTNPEKSRKISSDILQLPAADRAMDYFDYIDGANNPLLSPTIPQ